MPIPPLDAYTPATSELQSRAEQAAATGQFTGGPPDRYVTAGRMQFELLCEHGLTPQHRVVDIGGGAARLGYWLMNYLEPGNYGLLEPSSAMVAAGRSIVGDDLFARAKPVIDDNDQFDLAPFGDRDYGIARSVWTHAAIGQIDLLLASWAKHGRGPLFASYLPARGLDRGYRGTEWVGISHQSQQPGLVTHRLGRIRRLAARHGVTVTPLGEHVVGNQIWLKITA